MAYQSIGRGSSANDGTGDDLRTGAGKINANFVELYTLLGDGSALTSQDVVLTTETQTLTNKTITGTFTGNITGDVTGNVTGNVTGDVTGDVTGNLTGNVTGDVAGDLTGDVTGNLTGNVTGDLTGNVTGDVTGNLTGDVTGDVTGNVTGNLTGAVTGNVTGDVTGNVVGNLDGQVTLSDTTVVGDGSTTMVISPSTGLNLIQSSASAETASLADETTVGTVTTIVMTVDGGGDIVLTPTTLLGGSTITFADVGDSVTLVWSGTTGWAVASNNGAVVA